MNIALQDFNMKVIKIDGGNDIQSSDWVASVGILYPGERMDVVTSGDPGTSLTITLDPGYVFSTFLTSLSDPGALGLWMLWKATR